MTFSKFAEEIYFCSIVNIWLGSKYTSEYYNNFFPGVSKLKLMIFSVFFSTINFRYQYLSETKAYLEPWNFFAKNFFLQN